MYSVVISSDIGESKKTYMIY